MSLLFYDDSPVFGGHEVMTLLGLEAVLSDHPGTVHFLAAAANEKLCEKLAAIAAKHPNLRIEKLGYHSSKFESLRNLLKPPRAKVLASRLKELAPALVIAVQGNIEHSSLVLLAAKQAGIRSTSYIPVPHSNAEMGAKLGALRDLFAKPLFQVPDSFITITDEMAHMLRERGAGKGRDGSPNRPARAIPNSSPDAASQNPPPPTGRFGEPSLPAGQPIAIVYNGVDTGRFQPGDKQAARAELNLPQDKVLLGIIGRIEFRQKQQHLLIEAIAADPALKNQCHLAFAGDGPDVENLRSLIQRHGLSATIFPWTDPAKLYRALDAIVIPSRYEGLPLVMLEAIASGTAVLASDRDGMKDLLPPHWRFTPNEAAALGKAVSAFIAAGTPSPDPALMERVRGEMSLDAFRREFSRSLLDFSR